MREEDAQAAAVRRNFFNVEEDETMPPGDGVDGDSREVAEVLVVNGVELAVLDHRSHVRVLHGDRAGVGEQDAHALHGGEEYELIIAGGDLPSSVESVSLTHIGEIIESPLDHQLFLIDGTRESVLQPRAWQHFG